MTRRLTFLFAVAGGAAVANLYWAQPLLDFIARDLHASASSAGWLVTATQVGYAAGIALVVPLGDVVNSGSPPSPGSCSPPWPVTWPTTGSAARWWGSWCRAS